MEKYDWREELKAKFNSARENAIPLMYRRYLFDDLRKHLREHGLPYSPALQERVEAYEERQAAARVEITTIPELRLAFELAEYEPENIDFWMGKMMQEIHDREPEIPAAEFEKFVFAMTDVFGDISMKIGTFYQEQQPEPVPVV